MRKTDILQKLNELAFDASQYWVITGGAMVLYGIREETGDLDLGCTSELADMLEERGYPVTLQKDGTRKITVGEDVEIFENWLYDSVQLVEGFPVISLAGLVEMKKRLGREKDLRDIQLITAFRSLRYIENNLSYETYIDLRLSIPYWKVFSEAQTRKSLENSYYTITVLDGTKAVGMGRVVGDGMYFTIVDVVVRPEYQGRGIGSQIIDRLLAFIDSETPEGGRSSVQLIAEKGKEDFYQKKGFKLIPHEFCGSGMRKIILKDIQ